MDWTDTDHIDPGGHWIGWRLRGRVLISPDGDRITPERLRGVLFRESLELRRNKAIARRATIVPLSAALRQSVERLSGSRAGLERNPDIAIAADLLPFDG